MDPLADLSLPAQELGPTIQRRLREGAAPIRALLRSSLLVCGAAVLGVGFLIGVASAISPGARHYFFPPNLAASAGWQTSSAFPGTPPGGVGPSSPWPLFFHTVEETNASITIALPRPALVRRVRIRNREDCCQERAVPLDVEALGKDGPRLLCQRRTPFSTWTCNTDGVRTQRLRLRHPGLGTLHLAEIEVFE